MLLQRNKAEVQRRLAHISQILVQHQQGTVLNQVIRDTIVSMPSKIFKEILKAKFL